MLVGFRLRLFTLADELGNVSAACRAMGVDRSTYYRWKRKVDRWGLEALGVRERRRPRMPNQIGPHLEQRIIAFALGHPGLGPRRISAELVRDAVDELAVWRGAGCAGWCAARPTAGRHRRRPPPRRHRRGARRMGARPDRHPPGSPASRASEGQPAREASDHPGLRDADAALLAHGQAVRADHARDPPVLDDRLPRRRRRTAVVFVWPRIGSIS